MILDKKLQNEIVFQPLNGASVEMQVSSSMVKLQKVTTMKFVYRLHNEVIHLHMFLNFCQKTIIQTSGAL